MPGKRLPQAGGEGSTGGIGNGTEGFGDGAAAAREQGRAERGEAGAGRRIFQDERWSCGSDGQSCVLGMSKELLRFGLGLEVGDAGGGDCSRRLSWREAGYLCGNRAPSFAIPSSIPHWRWAHTADHTHQFCVHVAQLIPLTPHPPPAPGQQRARRPWAGEGGHTPLPARLKTNSPRLTQTVKRH